MDSHVSESMENLQSSLVPRSVVLTHTTHKIVNIVSSADHLFHHYLPSNDTVVLNYNRKMLPNVSAPVQTYRPIAPTFPNMDRMHHLTSEHISTSLSLPPLDSHSNSIMCSQTTTTLKNIEPKSSPCPIKLVDMKKLLERPPDESDETIIPDKIKDSSPNLSEHKIGGRKKNTPQKYIGSQNLLLHSDVKSNNKNIKSSQVTISQILDCLRVILPRTFDLSRLKPGDKVAALVIKYLKLDGSRNVLNQVKFNLKIIIDAAKLEEATYGHDATHPYHKIRYGALAYAIKRVFPEDFSVSDITSEKLKCLCVLLSLGVFIDGFNILRKKIHEFTREGRSCDSVIDMQTKSNFPSSDKCKTGSKTDNSTKLTNSNKRKQPTVTLPRDKSTESKSSNIKNNKVINTNKKQKINEVINLDIENNTYVILNNENNTNVTLNNENNSNVPLNNENNSNVTLNNENDTDVTLIDENNSKGQRAGDKKAKLATNMKLIINFLVLNKYSAECVLRKEKVLLTLCKYLHIKSRKSNLHKLRKMLLFIKQNNLNKDNTEMIEDAINRTIQGKNKSSENVEGQQQTSNVSQATCSDYLPPAQPRDVRQNYPRVKNRIKNKLKQKPAVVENKLNLRPVVVLHDLMDYASDQLLFMGKERKYKVKKRYHDLIVPIVFSEMTSLQRYPSDMVRKLTKESYKEFRRIVMKRNGNKVVFRLNYKRLNPGTTVFVKHFMCPLSGWLKGTVSKTAGPLSYIVRIENGEYWTCVPDQLRPLPENNLGVEITCRSQRRNIKPKQLFDL